jgi:MoaA/NifB/PqqE/SkfB family radical SAM enzyme
MAANFARNVACVHLKSRRFRPLMTNFYLTKRCNLRCRFCYPPGSEPELPVAEALRLLEKIRPNNPALNITGGEPLLYHGINAVLRRAGELGFHPLLLSTNALLIEQVAEDLKYVDHLVISLHSLSCDTCERLTGIPRSTPRIINAIRRSAELARSMNFKLSLHTVIAPETMAGIEEILEFCEEIGAQLSLSPEHGRYYPNRDLIGNKQYTDLIDRLLELKQCGKPLFSSQNYLKAIRNFSPHRCFPFVSPRVEPDGRVYFPCQRIARRFVYLQDYPNLCELMQREADQIPDSACAERCFLACYLEVAQYLHNPLIAISNLFIREALLGRR